MKNVVPILTGVIENKKLTISNTQKYHEHINSLGDCEVEIIIRKRKRIRTLPQNAFYWVYLQILSEDTGYTPQELHDLFKEAFIPAEKITAFGLETSRYKTTTDMSPGEFSEYINKIAEKTGIMPPNDEDAAKFSVN